MSDRSTSRRFFWRSVLLGFLLAAIVYFPMLAGKVPYPLDLPLGYPLFRATGLDPSNFPSHAGLEDAVSQSYPWFVQVHGRLRAGDLPFWDPLLLSGAPLLANPLHAALYPPHYLLALLPAVAAWCFRFPLRFWLAFVATAGCAREAGTSSRGAWLAGLAFSCSGFMVAYQTWPQTDSAVWLPATFWALFRLRRTGDRRALAALAVAAALSPLGGHPEIALFVAGALVLGVGALLTESTVGAPPPARFARLALLAGLLALGLAAAQILPSAFWLERVVRSLGEVDPRRLDPSEITTLVSRDLTRSPNAFGLVIPRAAGYVGIAALFLAPVALLVRPGRGRWLWLSLALAAASIVFGVPGVHELALATPVLSAVPRFRLLVVLGFALAMLAGLGWTALERATTPGTGRRVRRGLWLGGAFALALLALAFFQARGAAAGTRWDLGWASSAALILALAAALYTSSSTKAPPRALAAARTVALALCALDLLPVARAHLPYVETRFLSREPAAIEFLRAADRQAARVTAVDFAAPANAFHLAGLRDATGYDYVTRPIADVVNRLSGPGRRPRPHLPRPFSSAEIAGRDSRWLDLLGVRYLVSASNGDGSRRLAAAARRFVEVYDDGAVKIFENLRAQPAAWLVPPDGIRTLPDAERLDAVTHPGFDPRREAIVAPADAPVAATAAPACDLGEVQSLERAGDALRISLGGAGNCRALLVVSESFDPGWEASSGGAPLRVLAVDHALLGVELLGAEASGVVDLQYLPPGWRPGLAASLASCAIVIGLLVLPGRRARRADAADSAPPRPPVTQM